MSADLIAALFPPDVVVVTATPEMYDGALFPEEEVAVAKALEKRRREFTAGRVAAREALLRLGVPPGPLLPGEDRVPRWPEGVVGSISHTRDCCAVVVTRRGRIEGLGLDIEQKNPLGPGMVDLICTGAEQARFASLPKEIDWGKVTFSAKEAFYKCYYPIERVFLGFHDVELELDPEASSFVAAVVNPEKPGLKGSRVLQGNLRFDGQRVYAGVALQD